MRGWIMPELWSCPRPAPRRAAAGSRRMRFWGPGRGHDGAGASSKRPVPRPLTSLGNASMILRGSSSTPITPVEAGSTCDAGSFRSLAAALEVASATASPVRVAQLAFPALTRMAPRGRPTASNDAGKASPVRPGRVLGKHGGGRGRQPRDNQGEVVLLHLADAGVGGGVGVSER